MITATTKTSGLMGKGVFESVIEFDGKRWVKCSPPQVWRDSAVALDFAKMDADKLTLVLGLTLLGLGYKPETRS